MLFEVDGEESLRKLGEKLTSEKIDHKLWIEQPENIPVCIAVKPYQKEKVHPHLKSLKLFS